MDVFVTRIGATSNSIVELDDGKVAIILDRIEDGLYLASVYQSDGSLEWEPIGEDRMVEVVAHEILKIKRNAVRCENCQEVIVSKKPYDHIKCKCGACEIDGGKEYIRRKMRADAKYKELAVAEF